MRKIAAVRQSLEELNDLDWTILGLDQELRVRPDEINQAAVQFLMEMRHKVSEDTGVFLQKVWIDAGNFRTTSLEALPELLELKNFNELSQSILNVLTKSTRVMKWKLLEAIINAMDLTLRKESWIRVEKEGSYIYTILQNISAQLLVKVVGIPSDFEKDKAHIEYAIYVGLKAQGIELPDPKKKPVYGDKIEDKKNLIGDALINLSFILAAGYNSMGSIKGVIALLITQEYVYQDTSKERRYQKGLDFINKVATCPLQEALYILGGTKESLVEFHENMKKQGFKYGLLGAAARSGKADFFQGIHDHIPLPEKALMLNRDKDGISLLDEAILGGKSSIISKLGLSYTDIEPELTSKQMLFLAIQSGSLGLLTECLAFIHNKKMWILNIVDKNGDNILRFAVKRGNADMVRVILDKLHQNTTEKRLLYINSVNNNKKSALDLSMELNNTAITRLLLEAGANPEDERGDSTPHTKRQRIER